MADLYKNAFLDLLTYIREIAEDEETDTLSEYSRGRASGIHAVLLAVDTILESSEISRKDVGFEGLSAASWYEK